MKKILSALFASFGIGSAVHADQTVKMLDPKTIRYSMPTVASDDIEYVMPTKESFEGTPQFHEDEWCQLEFFPKERLAEIQKLLNELNAFEAKNRTQYGWNDIFARKINRTPILPRDVTPKEIGSLVSAQIVPSPILVIGSSPLGQVKDGFTLLLGTNAHLYGVSNSKGITVLGAHLADADDMLLAKAFDQLNKSYGQIFVDWRQQFVLVSVAPNGKFNVWKP